MMLWFAMALIVHVPTALAQSGARLVQCEITSMPDEKRVFKGRCVFQPEGAGSFALSSVSDNEPLWGNIAVVNVMIVQKDVAEVSALVLDKPGGGHTSRWGEARRSAQDKSCWVGVDFKVCAR